MTVAQVLQRQEFLPDRFRLRHIARLQGEQHLLGTVGRHAHAAGGEGMHAEFCPVDDGGLLADAADDQFRRHFFHQRFQKRILRGILTHHRVFDPGDDACIHQRLRNVHGDVAFVLDVKHHGLAELLRQFHHCGAHAIRF